MRDYATIRPTFWTGATGRAVRAAGRDAQVVALYLLSSPSSNMIGLYYLPIPTLCHETGLSPQGASKALARLSEAQFAHFDPVSEHVFVLEMARYQIGEALVVKDKRTAGVINAWQAMSKSPFYLDFWHRYRNAYHLPTPQQNGPEGKAHGRGFDAPTKPRTGTRAGSGAEEPTQEEGTSEGTTQADVIPFGERRA
jgi:hypothetical protein